MKASEMSVRDLSQSRLKEVLDYDPETGIFTWKTDKGTAKVGQIAGSISKGYRHIKLSNRVYKAHHLAWLFVYGELPKEIDHINHIKDDNSIKNLRLADRKQNGRNQSLHKTNTSGIAGVRQIANRWRADIMIDGKPLYLGRFKSKEGAVQARKTAERLYGFHENHGANYD